MKETKKQTSKKPDVFIDNYLDKSWSEGPRPKIPPFKVKRK
jgi:hypothetical protein